MPTLSTEIKTFIVTGLAKYDTPSDIVEGVRLNFGVEVTRQQVHAYDPSCLKPPAQRWRELHAATRHAFLNNIDDIGIAQKSYRLKMLHSMAKRAFGRHALGLTNVILDQAARECGGFYERDKPMMVVAATPTDPYAANGPADPLNASPVIESRAVSVRLQPKARLPRETPLPAPAPVPSLPSDGAD